MCKNHREIKIPGRGKLSATSIVKNAGPAILAMRPQPLFLLKLTNMKKEGFSVLRQLNSFRPALQGIRDLLITQHNARIHLTATITVVISGFLLQVSKQDWLLLAFAVGLVWVSEIFNTCIEKTLDFISLETHPEIKFIKDIAAGAVLIASLTAFIIGLIIFIPKIL